MKRDFECEFTAVFCEGEGATNRRGDRNWGEKNTAEANKRVPEVFNWQRQEYSSHKRKATAHLEEARAKFGKYSLDK